MPAQRGIYGKAIKIKELSRPSDRSHNLVDHLVLDNGTAIEDFHGDALTGLRVLSKLNLRKCSLANRPPDLVLPYFPHHHLSLFLSQIIFSLNSISALAPESKIFQQSRTNKALLNRQLFRFPKYSSFIVRSESKRKSKS